MADTVDTVVNELIINKLTQAQYDALTEKSPTELYFVTDAKEPLQVVDTVENFPACTVEDLGKLVLYTGPTTNSTEESVQLILDSRIINGHIFGVVEQTIAISETESETIYMWKDVYESLPTIEDSVTGKVLSNNGLYPEWVDMQSGISEIIHDTTLSGSGTAESPLKVADDTYLPLSGGTLTGSLTVNDAVWIQNKDGSGFSIKCNPYDARNMVMGGINEITGSFQARFYFSSNSIYPALSTANLGTSSLRWATVYGTKLNNGADIAVPTEGGTLARIEDIDAIGGDGTAGQVLTKTEVGMAWQDATGGGASIPDQTGNAGKFLTTDGTTASWGDALVNKSAYPDTNIILLGKRPNYGDGQNSKHVIIGLDATVYDFASYAVSIGWSASASSYAVAVGAEAKASTRAMQFGSGTNNDANTVKFANSNGNFEMMDANGNVPLERLTYVTNQIGDISTALTAILGE